MGPKPVTASMRRRLEPIEASLTIFTGRCRRGGATWVPPHSSIECSPGLEHPDDVAVLVAEEGDGAQLARPRPSSSRSGGPGRCARISSLARSSISADLVGGDRLEVAEVEPQPVGRRPASPAASRGRRAPRAAPSGGGGCRCGCGGWRRGARRRCGRGRLADLDGALAHLDGVAVQAGQGVGGVEHVDHAGVGGDRAGVADLAAGLGVERRAVEERRPSPTTPTTRGLGLVLLAAGELGGAVLGRGCRCCSSTSSPVATPPALAAARARGALVGHGRLEPGHVDLDAACSADLLGDLEREAVGVVQLERDRRRPARSPSASSSSWVSRICEPRGQRLAERSSSRLDDRQDQVAVSRRARVGVAHEVDVRSTIGGRTGRSTPSR